MNPACGRSYKDHVNPVTSDQKRHDEADMLCFILQLYQFNPTLHLTTVRLDNVAHWWFRPLKIILANSPYLSFPFHSLSCCLSCWQNNEQGTRINVHWLPKRLKFQDIPIFLWLSFFKKADKLMKVLASSKAPGARPENHGSVRLELNLFTKSNMLNVKCWRTLCFALTMTFLQVRHKKLFCWGIWKYHSGYVKVKGAFWKTDLYNP